MKNYVHNIIKKHIFMGLWTENYVLKMFSCMFFWNTENRRKSLQKVRTEKICDIKNHGELFEEI